MEFIEIEIFTGNLNTEYNFLSACRMPNSKKVLILAKGQSIEEIKEKSESNLRNQIINPNGVFKYFIQYQDLECEDWQFDEFYEFYWEEDNNGKWEGFLNILERYEPDYDEDWIGVDAAVFASQEKRWEERNL